ncbi:GntR family transcriptional regulator [Parasphaerochaeta coccoides]|uniref:Transcriptional regulator, GntR family n=1 Tax=Parasphaerochaeta coccoides (strain ATCC BAA-1237 / DSM 17374 / SPN1) TaxID=760011 RepID=F4GL57_PARC1|nr:GntR family transcriptional regulator [Parasphaerochaeta coccoides]AEC02397.1 transcriptional regulator, GntR family [Parasphaerochaeta coccoides DSM 17374]
MERPSRITASDGIFDILRRQILSLTLPPGEELNINFLAGELGVSRSPVRDALIKLSRDKLVDVFPQKGTRVALLDVERVEDERFMRRSMEEAAVKIFAASHHEDDMAILRHAIALQMKAMEKEDYLAFLESDDAFHYQVFNAIGRSWCWDVISTLCGNHHRIRLLSFRLEGVLGDIVAQHERMMDAFGRRDVDESCRLENSHLSKLTDETVVLRKKFPNYFIV